MARFAIQPRRLIAALPLLLAFLLATTRASAASGTCPAKLEPYVQLTAQCAQYQALVTGRSCQLVYREDFTQPSPATTASPGYSVIIPDDADPATTQATPEQRAQWTKLVDDANRRVLVLAAPFERQLLKIGPKIHGDFVVEYVGKATSDQLCDLSILSDGEQGDTGPGFQFGANWNTNNRLCTGPAINPSGKLEEVHVRLPDTPLLVRDRWYRVRVQVRSGQIAAYVDGKLIGRAPLAAGYDPQKDRQLMIYCYRGSIRLAEVTITQQIASGTKLDPAAAWSQVFGTAKPEDIQAKLTALVQLLDDPDLQVRDAAQNMLWHAGDLAAPALKAASQPSSPELHDRAKALLDSQS